MVIKEAMRYVESEEMAVFLASSDIGLDSWCKIVAASRADIADKAITLREIARLYPADEHCNPTKLAEIAEAGIAATHDAPPSSFFLLTRFNRSKSWAFNDHWHFEEPARECTDVYATFDQAMQAIHEDYESDDEQDGEKYDDKYFATQNYTMYWNEITRYDRMDCGSLTDVYTWMVGESGIIWALLPLS